jgi:hypothetical protein
MAGVDISSYPQHWQISPFKNAETETLAVFLLYLELNPPPMETGKSNTSTNKKQGKIKNRF